MQRAGSQAQAISAPLPGWVVRSYAPSHPVACLCVLGCWLLLALPSWAGHLTTLNKVGAAGQAWAHYQQYSHKAALNRTELGPSWFSRNDSLLATTVSPAKALAPGEVGAHRYFHTPGSSAGCCQLDMGGGGRKDGEDKSWRELCFQSPIMEHLLCARHQPVCALGWSYI